MPQRVVSLFIKRSVCSFVKTVAGDGQSQMHSLNCCKTALTNLESNAYVSLLTVLLTWAGIHCMLLWFC